MLYPPAATSPLACPCGLPDGGRFVPFCVPDDPQSHINKGGGSSIRGCYALYLYDARVAHQMRKDPAVFAFYLSFSHFVKLQIPAVHLSFSCGKPAPKPAANQAANQAANLQQILLAAECCSAVNHAANLQQITMQITMQTCSKSPYKQRKSHRLPRARTYIHSFRAGLFA